MRTKVNFQYIGVMSRKLFLIILGNNLTEIEDMLPVVYIYIYNSSSATTYEDLV